MTAVVGAEGVTISVPEGWDARARRTAAAPADGGSSPRSAGTASGATAVVLHAGSFPLPSPMGDYGSGAVEVMRAADVLLCLLEHDPADVDAALFRREGVPPVHQRDFREDAMQRVIPGMAGAQWFFRTEGRCFCLYGVLGSYRARGTLAPRLAAVVDTLTIS
jgi:hypothetical protein